MQYLQARSGKAVSRYDLMEAVWGYRNETASNVVDVVVRSLRGKLGFAGRRGRDSARHRVSISDAIADPIIPD
jgi:DNA-binding response OmpR family regulator